MVAYIVLDNFGTYQTCNLSTRNLIEFITVHISIAPLIRSRHMAL